MTQPTDRPGIDQLRNLADRAERHGGLTPDEAARLRDGIDALHIRLWNAEGSSKAWERKADEQQARAENAEATLTAVCAAANDLADGTEAGFRAALALRAVLDQHGQTTV